MTMEENGLVKRKNVGVSWAIFTDVITLHKTEDMVGSENAISIN